MPASSARSTPALEIRRYAVAPAVGTPCHARFPAEGPAETAFIPEAGFERDHADALVGGAQQVLGALQALQEDELGERHAE